MSPVAPRPLPCVPAERRSSARARRDETGRSRTEVLLTALVVVIVSAGGGSMFLSHRSDSAAAVTTTTRAPLVVTIRPFVESPNPGENYTDPNGLFRVRS